MSFEGVTQRKQFFIDSLCPAILSKSAKKTDCTHNSVNLHNRCKAKTNSKSQLF